MNKKEEFIALIESIGFKYNINKECYDYKGFKIIILPSFYGLNTDGRGGVWNSYVYSDLKPLLKLIRSDKLKKMLK